MKKYTLYIASRVKGQLYRHAEFLSRVSLPAADRFYRDFERVGRRIEENPYQFPLDQDTTLPVQGYRKALFAKWYKALFTVEGNRVFLDEALDCRQDNSETEK